MEPKKEVNDAVQHYCICVLSNIEGLKNVVLPTGSEARATIENLDRRTRGIESMMRIAAPPPMLETSWDSLAWRICRLERLLSHVRIPINLLPPGFETVSVSLLQSILASIPATHSTARAFVWPEKEDLEEKELIELAAQWLWHMAGLRGMRIVHVNLELKAVCMAGADISLMAERPFIGPYTPPGGQGPVHPHGIPPAPHIINMRAPPHRKKACCGCCICSCHKRESGLRDDSSSSIVLRRRRRGRWCGWLQKLAFWRRNKFNDAASFITTSSSSSSTIAD
ncbi:hypothetical protein F4778DRAFT_137981 [Xylariomycetidae sp. FL2044]|nr:hypothetical protein F4778DRAFT_137981 [Xylariomycetidae sp. FL2044]